MADKNDIADASRDIIEKMKKIDYKLLKASKPLFSQKNCPGTLFYLEIIKD